MSNFKVEQLNNETLAASYNVGKYLRSASIETELADALRSYNIDNYVIEHCCNVVVEHFATAMFLEDMTDS
jgi:hypothetical protein